MTARIEAIIDRRITLSYPAFDVLYCGECGEDAVKPGGLEGLSPGATYADRVRLVREVLADLRGRGLAVVDTPAASLLETMRLLHSSHRRVFGWYVVRNGDNEIPGSFHIAESDDLAVLAQLENDQVTLEPVPWDRVFSTALEFPPWTEPVAGGEIVVPLESLATAPLASTEWLEALQERPQRTATQIDRDRIRVLADPATLRFAMQVLTARRDSRGEEIVSEFPLNYYVGEHGAFLTVHKRSDPESEPLLHMIPATRASFLQEIQNL